ncbi:MAG: DNA-binding protein WhiA [Caldiserica bacterium]|nr:DNA-binding protein WhiA [Caldisericota bacterium]
MTTIDFLKQELAGLPSTDPLLELSGALYGGSSLVLHHAGALSISFTSKSPLIMRYVLSLSSHALTRWLPGQALLSRTGHKLSFGIDLAPAQSQQLFSGLSPLEPTQLEKRLRGKRAAAAFTKGFFLISGYAAVQGTHLEFSCSLPVGRRLVERSLTSLRVTHGSQIRRFSEITYLKSRQDIMSLLAAWGASNSLLSLEELQLEKDMDNQVNRSVNAELGNLERETMAFDQLRAAFDRTDRTRLSSRTVEVVQARLKYPDLPLSKLVDKIPGRISKSTIHYHIDKVLRTCATVRNSVNS